MPTIRQCSSPECTKPVRTHGLCTGHYKRLLEGRDLDTPLRELERGNHGCKIEGCGRPHKAKGYCKRHYYQRQWRDRNPVPALGVPLSDPNGAVWRPVAGFEDQYEVSEDGRVRSVPRYSDSAFGGKRARPGKNLKTNLVAGYPFVMLSKKGKRYCRRVHVLVAAAFIGPRPLGLTIHHKDHDKTNNHRSNLEYLTQKQNIRKAVEAGRFDRSKR